MEAGPTETVFFFDDIELNPFKT